MLQLTKNLALKTIEVHDHTTLYNLMNEIYPPEYNHFWLDDSSWYINSQYSIENLQKELSEENQCYYFVVFKDEIVGILRLLLNVKMKAFENKKAIKLHRIYLHNKVQGNGIGKAIINYVEQLTKENNYAVLWLEGMEKKSEALNFYKKLGFLKGDEYLYEFDLLKKEYQKMIALYKEY